MYSRSERGENEEVRGNRLLERDDPFMPSKRLVFFGVKMEGCCRRLKGLLYPHAKSCEKCAGECISAVRC